jgi:hypothetical protein
MTGSWATSGFRAGSCRCFARRVSHSCKPSIGSAGVRNRPVLHVNGAACVVGWVEGAAAELRGSPIPGENLAARWMRSCRLPDEADDEGRDPRCRALRAGGARRHPGQARPARGGLADCVGKGCGRRMPPRQHRRPAQAAPSHRRRASRTSVQDLACSSSPSVHTCAHAGFTADLKAGRRARARTAHRPRRRPSGPSRAWALRPRRASSRAE